jgi:hypothetical protein
MHTNTCVCVSFSVAILRNRRYLNIFEEDGKETDNFKARSHPEFLQIAAHIIKMYSSRSTSKFSEFAYQNSVVY